MQKFYLKFRNDLDLLIEEQMSINRKRFEAEAKEVRVPPKEEFESSSPRQMRMYPNMPRPRGKKSVEWKVEEGIRNAKKYNHDRAMRDKKHHQLTHYVGM